MVSQAIVVHPELLAKVKKWALEHKAWVPVRYPSGCSLDLEGRQPQTPTSSRWGRAFTKAWSSFTSRSCDDTQSVCPDEAADRCGHSPRSAAASPKEDGGGGGSSSSSSSAFRLQRYCDVVASAGAEVKWSGIKALRRAMEKMVRSYRHDPSRLLDLCRQSLVFQDLDDLLGFLDAMRFDSDIQIVRLHNLLDPSYSAAHSAGYRDVHVNLRMRTPAVLAGGAWGHVCEVQLLLIPFARIKSDEGHQRYILYRDIRGQ